MAAIFAILAVIFYFASIQKLDRSTASIFGISEIANIQGTVFTGICAILCGINIVGAIIIGAMENNPNNDSNSSADIAREVFNAIKQNEEEEKKKTEKEKLEKLEMEKRQEETKQKTEAIRALKENGEILKEEQFLSEIADETSMIAIWKIWEQYNLNESNKEANEFIRKYKDAERLYGKSRNINKLKEELKQILLPWTTTEP